MGLHGVDGVRYDRSGNVVPFLVRGRHSRMAGWVDGSGVLVFALLLYLGCL